MIGGEKEPAPVVLSNAELAAIEQMEQHLTGVSENKPAVDGVVSDLNQTELTAQEFEATLEAYSKTPKRERKFPRLPEGLLMKIMGAFTGVDNIGSGPGNRIR